MSPLQIITQAQACGVTIMLSATGTIKVAGDKSVVEKWLPIIRSSKAEIVEYLQRKNIAPKGTAKSESVPPRKAVGMSYEDFLTERRKGGNGGKEGDSEIARTSKLKTIANEIIASQRLECWLNIHAGKITVIRNSEDAVVAVNRLKESGGVIGIDIETAKAIGFETHPHAGLHPLVSRIRLVQLFKSKTDGVLVIDCFAAGYEWLSSLQGGHYVAHNAQFECSHFWHHIKVELNIDCTMLAGRVFYGENRKLSDLVAEHLDLNMSKALQVSDWARPELLEEQICYAAADAVAAKLLWQKFGEMFPASYDKYYSAYQFIRSLIYPVIRQAGIGFDLDGHAKVVADWEREQQETRDQLAQLGLLNPASVKQKQKWLGERLSHSDLEDWERTETGSLSTKADALQNALHIDGAAPLARWSRVSTRLANFGHSLVEKVIDGNLYPNYRITGGVTGRFGCNNPNIQNQPREGFKQLYRAPEGSQLVTGDLSQIELRVAGQISGDPVINAAYAQGRDLHREVAAERAGKSPESITKAERQAAKAINFGLIFGAGAQTLRQQAINSYGVDMSLEEAMDAKSFFHNKYQRLSEWQQEAVAHANAYEYSESPYFKLTRHYTTRVYTHAMNYPVQSGAWEVLALAILYIDARLPADGSIRISHHVYDELCLLARDDKVLEAALLLRDGFLHGFLTVFPNGATRGLVEIGAGRTWADAGNEANRIKEASL